MNAHSVSFLKDKLNTSTQKLVLLSAATGGIYMLMWLYRHHDTITEEVEQGFSSRVMIIWMAVCFGMAAFLRPLFPVQIDEYGYSYDSLAETMSVICFLLSLAAIVLYIVWAFKARMALQQYALTQYRFELKMNPVWTILFHVFYISYCINAMPDALAKHQIIHGKPEVSAADSTPQQ